MIHVTQGHESGIGLEVFIKSLLAINLSLAESFILHVEEESLKKNLEFLNIDYSLSLDSVEFEDRKLKLSLINKANGPLSTLSLESALNLIPNEDVLFTLPTSKDQLLYEGQRCSGYTEYFRARFGIQSLVMIFKCQEGFTGLLTDHIPLRLVSEVITEDLVCEKFNIIRNELKKYYKKDFEYIFSGINPHSGEGGILGDEDGVITKAIEKIRSDHPELKVMGPLPGDTLHFEKTNRENKVFIYAAHDQALATFKEQNGLLGINTTLGLPFIRLSVDHGTAFELYGKNKADFKGCLFGMKEALRINS